MNRPKFQQSIMRLRSARQAGINAVQRQPNTMSAFGNKSLVFGFMSYDHAEKMDLNDITKFVTVRSTLNLSWMNLKQEPVTVSKCVSGFFNMQQFLEFTEKIFNCFSKSFSKNIFLHI